MIARTILRFRKNTKASVAAKNQKQNTFAILAGVKRVQLMMSNTVTAEPMKTQ